MTIPKLYPLSSAPRDGTIFILRFPCGAEKRAWYGYPTFPDSLFSDDGLVCYNHGVLKWRPETISLTTRLKTLLAFSLFLILAWAAIFWLLF